MRKTLQIASIHPDPLIVHRLEGREE